MLWAMESAKLWPNSGADDGLQDTQTRYREALVAGHVAARQGRLEDALDAYRRAGELVGHRAVPLVRQGSVLHQLGRLEDALAVYRRALEISPGDSFALAGHAAALGGLERKAPRAALPWPVPASPAVLEDAQARYREALVAGHVATQQGRLEDALDAYRRAGELAVHRAVPLARQGSVLHQLGRLEESLAAYRRAAEIAPGDAFVLAGHVAALGPLEGPGRRAVPWPVAVSATVLLPIVYAIVLLVSEALVTFVDPLLVFPLHGGLVVAVSLHLAWLARRPVETAESRALTALLLSFVVAPLIRIISLTLPLAQIEPAYRYLFAGVPMALGALLVARTLGLGRQQIGIVWRKPRWQVLAVVGSLGLGLIEFTILRPAPMGAFPWTLAGLLPALAVGIFTGFPEELIFRGLMQTTARPIMRSGTILYAATVFAVLHLGYESVTDLVFVFAVGLFYGWIFERSRSIVGISIGHGLANVVLFFVAPHLMSVLTGRPLF
jgi:membrane protease YdiL (CAAX protease family)/Flp pilus assembly protein TadD